MKILVNQTALARLLDIAPATMRTRIRQGKYKPVAKDNRGRPLFERPNEKPKRKLSVTN